MGFEDLFMFNLIIRMNTVRRSQFLQYILLIPNSVILYAPNANNTNQIQSCILYALTFIERKKM